MKSPDRNKQFISNIPRKLNTLGKATLLVGTKDAFSPVEFQIVDHKVHVQLVLGLQTCLDLKLIKRMYRYTVNSDIDNDDPNKLPKDYRDVFIGLGCLPGNYNIQLNADAKPVVHPPRKIPFAQRKKIKKELDRMVRDSVIPAVKDPTD